MITYRSQAALELLLLDERPTGSGTMLQDHQRLSAFDDLWADQRDFICAAEKMYRALSVVREALAEGGLTAEHIAVIDTALVAARGPAT